MSVNYIQYGGMGAAVVYCPTVCKERFLLFGYHPKESKGNEWALHDIIERKQLTASGTGLSKEEAEKLVAISVSVENELRGISVENRAIWKKRIDEITKMFVNSNYTGETGNWQWEDDK